MSNYKTPGVYVEEVSTFPPSVAQVATAIPAFIGYTEKGPKNVATRITSMLDYENIFGGSSMMPFTVTLDSDYNITDVSPGSDDFILYYSMKLFFANGGGACYIVSTGTYEVSTPGVGGNPATIVSTEKSASDFTSGLDIIAKVDEPTLLVFSDALSLTTGYSTICETALSQCATLKDRFTIMDLAETDKDASLFRAFSLENLDYGAAYTPHLNTTIPYQYKESDVLVQNTPVITKWSKSTTLVPATGDYVEATMDAYFIGTSDLSPTPTINVVNDDSTDPVIPTDDVVLIALDDSIDNYLTITIQEGTTTTQDIINAWSLLNAIEKGGFVLNFTATAEVLDVAITTAPREQVFTYSETQNVYLNELKTENTTIYNQVKTELSQQYVQLPPSSAMAGIYTQVDATRGVWKAPANVTVSSVTGPSRVISNADQGLLNVDPTSGKSINAIRNFTGKGTLVWGARTLLGNDNNWRYINVRRLFITIEESVQKSTAFAVFEPNDATTWLKVKAMIDNYLYGLWQQGALAGSTPAAAYYVNIGLGQTMTNDDILNGEMIVEVGVAAVRPAEFITLRFSQKLQEA